MGSIGDGGRRRRASYYNTQQTAKRQDNALASQIRQQSENQRKADARTGQMIQQQSQQTDQKEKSAGLLANQNVLQAKAAQAQKVSQASGAVSNAYQQAGANAAQGITSYGNQQSDLLSSINAPGQQRANNRVNIDSYAQDLGQIARKSKGDDFLAQIRQGGIRRNPYLDLASSLLGGASRAYRGGDDPDYSYLLDANASSGRSTGTWNGYDYLSSLFDPATGSYSNPYAPPETVAI